MWRLMAAARLPRDPFVVIGGIGATDAAGLPGWTHPQVRIMRTALPGLACAEWALWCVMQPVRS